MSLLSRVGLLLAGAGLWFKHRDTAYAIAREQAAGTPMPRPIFTWDVDPPGTPAWTPPAAAQPYMAAIRQAEALYQLPPNLLARVLYQESRFRPDIIHCETISSAGAMGIAQIVPRWHPTVDPCDPWDSIDYAGQYLAQLFDLTGSWERAVAAYNWGIGNLNRQGLAGAPKETRDYIASMKADGFLA